MKRLFIFLFTLVILSFVFVLPLCAKADDAKTLFNAGLNTTAVGTGHTGLKTSGSLTGTIALVIKIALSVIGIAFLILIIYAGFIWMMSRGNEQDVGKAKTIITNSIIGLIIVMASYAITVFIGEYFIKVVVK